MEISAVRHLSTRIMTKPLRQQRLREEAEVVPILLGELDEGGPQRYGRLLDKLFEVDDLCANTR